MLHRLTLLVTAWALAIASATAQPGAIDPTFNPTDPGFGNGDGVDYVVNATVVQPDGKILIAGDFTSYNGTTRNNIARLNADGSLDTGFDPGTGTDTYIFSMVLQPDGKILIGGAFTNYNGTPRPYIARLNTNGSLDAGFNPGGGPDDWVISIAVQTDGRILIGGFFTTYNGTGRNRIARLNATGSLHTGFTPGTGTDNTVRSIVVQPDGKVLIGGDFTSYNGTTRNSIARLNSTGSLDTGFSPGTGANDWVLSVALQTDGKVIIGGYFTSYNGTTRNYVARLNSTGSLDTGFITGTGADGEVNSIALQPDGKVLIGGGFETYNGTVRNHVARLNATGSLDTGFNSGTTLNSSVETIDLQTDGKVIIGGYFDYYGGPARNHIARLNTSGSLDTSFNPGTGANEAVRAIVVQSDGRILIGGEFTGFNGTARNRVARLNSSGSLHTGFNPGTGADGDVNAIVVQADGKILVGGGFSNFNDVQSRRIARLNANGSLDATFTTWPGASNTVEALAVQSDGKILVGGAFTSFDGTTRNRIARANADGNLDTGFNPGTGANNRVRTIAVQSDGKILIGGDFTSYNGTARNYIARLNSNGTLDTGFNPGSGLNGWVYSIVVQPDGRILVGGEFSTYNGTPRSRIVRVNSTGSVDTSFDLGTGANAWVESIVLQPDGKILIGGYFTSYNGTVRNGIARLNANGGLDPSFDPGNGAGNSAVAIQSDGKILIGGTFTSYNGTGRNRIARVLGGGLEVTSLVPATPYCAGGSVSVNYTASGTYNAGNSFTAQLSDATGFFPPTPVVLGTVSSTTSGTIVGTIDPGTLAGAGYRIRVVSSNPVLTGTDNGADLTVIALATWYADVDGDGFGDPAVSQFACTQPDDHVTNNTDECPTDINKQVPGVCGCGTPDVPTTWFADTDGDGFGDPGNGEAGFTCDQPTGYVSNNTDLCPDDEDKTAPGACGCGTPDVPTTWYADTDGDGFGDPGNSEAGFTCDQPIGYVSNNTDLCPEDANKTAPGACGCGTPDVPTTWYADTDNDGLGDPGNSQAGYTCNQPAGYVGNNMDMCVEAVDGIANFDENTCACALGYFATITDINGNDVITACTICPPGSYCPDGIDQFPCAAGYFSASSGQIVCNACSAGTFSAVTGSTECESCAAGYYNPTTAATECLACEAGTFSAVTGSIECQSCAAGYYNPTTAATECLACGAGTFSAVTGSIACAPCEAGYANNTTAATSCTACPPGSYSASSGMVLCSLCPVDTYNPLSAQTECIACPNGESSGVGAIACTPDLVCTTTLNLVFNGDGITAVSWELREQGSNTVIQSGGPVVYPDLVFTPEYSISTCLPDGDFYLVVTSSSGNGITANGRKGGYRLQTTAGVRLIDNTNNFLGGTTSQIAGGQGFTLPVGTDRLIYTSCDKMDWRNGEYIVANNNTQVAGFHGGTFAAQTGYEMWFYNPNGGYSFRRFHSHAVSDGFAPNNPQRACHIRVNGWGGVNAIPAQSDLLNVKVRGRVMNMAQTQTVNLPWGPACRFKMDANRAACPLTHLMDVPGNQYLSCGGTRPIGSNGASLVHARPVSRYLNGVSMAANRYQFMFVAEDTTYKTSAIGQYWVNTAGLDPCVPYEVYVRASFNNGSTWCDTYAAANPYSPEWGRMCILNTACAAGSGNQNMSAAEGPSTSSGRQLTLYPNPNNGELLFLSIDMVKEGVEKVNVDIYDSFGKRVNASTIAVNEGFVNTTLDLNGSLAAGMYIVNITAGDDSYTERLVIQP